MKYAIPILHDKPWDTRLVGGLMAGNSEDIDSFQVHYDEGLIRYERCMR